MQKIKAVKMVIAVLCVAVLAYVAWTYFKPKQEQPQYITAEVSRASGSVRGLVLTSGVTSVSWRL